MTARPSFSAHARAFASGIVDGVRSAASPAFVLSALLFGAGAAACDLLTAAAPVVGAALQAYSAERQQAASLTALPITDPRLDAIEAALVALHAKQDAVLRALPPDGGTIASAGDVAAGLAEERAAWDRLTREIAAVGARCAVDASGEDGGR